jgi:hypothetical protein
MRYFLLITLLLTIITSIKSQTKLDFENDGRLKSRLENYYERSTKFNLTPGISQVLTNDQKDSIRLRLKQKFQRVYDQLTDEESANFLIALWGATTYNKLRDEAEALRDYFRTGRMRFIWYRYFPAPTEFDRVINQTGIFSLDSSFSEGKKQLTLNLTYSDPLRKWIIDEYNWDFNNSGFRDIEKTATYYRMWDNLEKKTKVLQSKIDELGKLPEFNCSDDYSSFKTYRRTEIENDPLLKLIKEDPLLKKWIWFSDGVFMMNPIKFTNPEKEWSIPELR